MDPTAKDQNYADAKWGIILEKMSKDDFEEAYPDAMLPQDSFKEGKGLSAEHWYDSETVTVAEYFAKTSETVEMVQLEDGRVMTESDFKKLEKEWKADHKELLAEISNVTSAPQPNAGVPSPTAGGPSPLPVGMPAPPPQTGQGAGQVPPPPVPPAGLGGPQPPAMPPEPPPETPLATSARRIDDKPVVVKRRSTERTIIKQWISTCCEILDGGAEGNTVAGKHIPIVLLKGKELNIEGKNHVYSLIRHAKDPQKLINYWNTAAAEVIALAPKAPWVGTAKQFEGYESDYAAANVENFPLLKYNADSEAQGAPQRQGAGQPPVAIFEQIRRGEDNLKSVIGMFNADVGAPGSEQTGAAITARQKPGDVATFEFMENLARAIMHTGRIINEMIPEIYDTERDVRIRNIDESESFVPVNTTLGAAKKAVEKDPERFKGIDPLKLRDLFAKDGKDAKFNDITVGKYNVVVTVGPSYATQRQESAQHLMQLVQAMPNQMGIAADLIVENMDFKQADELAARLRKALPPNIVKQRPGEEPPKPPQPPPQVLLAQAKVETEKIKAEMAKAKLELEKVKVAKESGKQPETPDPKLQIDAQLAQMNLQMEQLKMQHDKERMAAEQEASKLRTQLEQSRLQFELQKQQLQIQQQRELHSAKLREMEVNQEIKKEEAKNKPKPVKKS
jgi:hypothetical protein